MSAGISSGTCPFAVRPDATGCDCDCRLPRPKGFLAALAWWLTPAWCTSGTIGQGSGELPCAKYDRWRKENGREHEVSD